ncbi:hypothetical protein MPSI1_001350 [Malassezia psittaci]|uniref:Proteasome assembly chaperone 2 n=1 Tax=Malassezia psittaci TaxID=1821823 RepID=A0AAF0JD82_9BASI|nr:hypothetical protein MPSI1_001350 [Malassezia psittaci]
MPESSAGVQFEGCTLILPVISVGLVPSLAVDLLVHAPALNFSYVASLDGTDCVPFVGPADDPPADHISTALDVYKSKSHDLVVVQQRSPILKTHKKQFVRRLMEWIKEAKLANILVLATLDAAFRSDAEMMTSQWKYMSSTAATSPLTDRAERLPMYADGNPSPPMPGAEITQIYLQNAPSTTLALLQFCAEGDNREDAYQLAESAARICGVSVDRWFEPKSWQSLFGPKPDQQLYG